MNTTPPACSMHQKIGAISTSLYFAVALLVSVGTPARSQVIFSTDFSNASQPTLNGPINMGGTLAPEVSVSTLAKGATATFTIFEYDTTSGGGFDTAPLFAGARPSQLPNSFDTSQYIEFTLNNLSAAPLQLTGFSFALLRKGFAGDAGATLRSSLDSYAVDLIAFSNNALSGTKSPVNVDWSSSPLDLGALDAMTFRVYLWSPTTPASAARLGIDDIQITAVPEPSTWALLAASATVLIIFRRRRHTQSLSPREIGSE